MYGENIVAPPGNQAANRENKYSPVIRGPRSTRLSFDILLGQQWFTGRHLPYIPLLLKLLKLFFKPRTQTS
jgi:hypothetical protein